MRKPDSPPAARRRPGKGKGDPQDGRGSLEGAAIPGVDNIVSNVFIGRDGIAVALAGADLHRINELGFRGMASPDEVARKEGMALVPFYVRADGTGQVYLPGTRASETGETRAFSDNEMLAS
jgi:hypothetical protein